MTLNPKNRDVGVTPAKGKAILAEVTQGLLLSEGGIATL